MLNLLIPLGTGLAGCGAGLLLDRAVETLPKHAAVEAHVTLGGPSDEGKGKCDAACRPLGKRRQVPMVLSVSLAWTLLAVKIQPSWTLLVVLILAATVTPLAFCDYEHYLLPKRLVWPGTAAILGVLLLATMAGGSPGHLVLAGACALGAAGLLAFFWLASPRWLAFGDVRMAVPIGLAVGWVGPGATFLAILIANLGAGITVTALLATGRMSRGGHVPFGVFLAIGSVAALLVSAR